MKELSVEQKAKRYDEIIEKMSDEQMEVLKEALNIAGSKYKSCLNSLYSDLMKLKD